MFEFASPLDGFRSPFGAQRGGALQRIIAMFSDPAATGWFYDQNDLSTMFQDSAGTTPADFGLPVGLMLDKSKGLVLGPELVTNGDFSVDANWTKGTGWIIGGGVASKTTADNTSVGQVLATTVGATYTIVFSITVPSVSSGVRIFAGGLVSGFFNAVGTYSVFFRASASSTTVNFNGGSFSGGSIDNISVRELPGNHRVQTVSNNRPILGRHPFGGIRNLLTRTEEFENADWSKNNATVTPNAAVSPDGTVSAEKIVPTAGTNISTPVVFLTASQTAETRTFTAFMKSAEYSKGFLRIGGAHPSDVAPTAVYDLANGTVLSSQGTSIVASISPIGSGWYRCGLTYKNGPNSSGTGQAFVPNIGAVSDTYSVTLTDVLTTTNGTSGILIWGAQLELGSTATAYQRVGSAFDVTEAGVPSINYLAYNGTSTSLSTSAFAWGTDKATVVVGVRKLSDAAGIVTELSATIASSAGSFYLVAGDDLAAQYSSLGRGSAGGTGGQAAKWTSAPAPDTAVLTATHDIAVDLSTIRRNGVVGTDGTGDKGTGNFGTYQAFFGARGGTSVFLNGREYPNFAINRLLTANELSQLERFTAQRTGVTIA